MVDLKIFATHPIPGHVLWNGKLCNACTYLCCERIAEMGFEGLRRSFFLLDKFGLCEAPYRARKMLGGGIWIELEIISVRFLYFDFRIPN